MSRKIGGFLVFAATSVSFIATAVVRQEQISYAILAIILTIFALAGLRNHFKELR